MQIGSVDTLIAGTALERDETTLTRNVGEFERVADIVVESYQPRPDIHLAGLVEILDK